jgi:tetratricopeptide (TPR) repeat protein
MMLSAVGLYLVALLPPGAKSFMPLHAMPLARHQATMPLEMVATSLSPGWTSSHDSWGHEGKHRVRKKYKRKRDKPPTEKASDKLRRLRQAKFEEIQNKGNPNIFAFESLFPEPVIDEATVHRDLYEILERDEKVGKQKSTRKAGLKTPLPMTKMRSSTIGSNSMMRAWREPKLSYNVLSFDPPTSQISSNVNKAVAEPLAESGEASATSDASSEINNVQHIDMLADNIAKEIGAAASNVTIAGAAPPVIDRAMSRMVEDRVYGYRRSSGGAFEYDTSLMGDGAVKFRDGVRLGNALKVNADRLTYHARKELARGRVEEAQELYERAIAIDPRDGRAYLGLSKVAERRRDFKLAKDCLRAGIANSVSLATDEKYESGGNPFLLQALGCLEEKAGNLAEAEALYIAAAKSRPSHAAAWVSLAQLRTRKLRQSASVGRVCFQTAERELKRAGKPASSHVYTAWASMEYKKAGDVRRARELFRAALEVDPKCSPALLQLGVMEADKENWDEAENCFERVLKNDQRNSRVLQAYAIMETKRPKGDSRKAIGLFERALKANPRDAGALQAYALYVRKLGDIDAARDL